MNHPERFVHRRSPRIPGYDYSKSNFYFVTICTCQKKCIFGMPGKLSALGDIAAQDLEQLHSHYPSIYVDAFVVMPNHIHAIIVINEIDGGAGPALDSVIGQYKAGVSRKIRKLKPGIQVWQRSFHDHVIRSRSSYEKIYGYIVFNPQKWEEDCFYPNREVSVNLREGQDPPLRTEGQ